MQQTSQQSSQTKELAQDNIELNQFREQWRQEIADRQLAEQLQQEEQKQQGSEPVGLAKLFNDLSNINKFQPTKDDTWATANGIYQTLHTLLGNHAHVVNPDLSSISSPLDSRTDLSRAGIINYAKMIAGYRIADNEEQETQGRNGLIHQDGGALNKPIVMILNTSSVQAKNKLDTMAIGGHHWVVCVILPKNYKTPVNHTAMNNTHEQLIFIDPLGYKARAFPELFLQALTQGITDKFATENRTVTHMIPPAFPELEVVTLPVFKQQEESYDCGWWAVYNALMVVLTGRTEFLKAYTKPGREVAYALRTLFPGLSQQAKIGSVVEIASQSEANQELQSAPNKPVESSVKEGKVTHAINKLPAKIPANKRPKVKYWTNMIAIAFGSVGLGMVGGAEFFQSYEGMTGLAGVGIGVAGVGILPRIFVWMIEVHEGILGEVKIKGEINRLLDKLKKPREEKDALTKKYKLNTTYRSHVGAFLLNVLTTLWSYFITIMAVLGPDKVSKQADSESTYNQVRKGVITGGPVIEGILAGLVLHFQTRSVKWQAKLEQLKAQLEHELEQQQEKQQSVSTTIILKDLCFGTELVKQSATEQQAEQEEQVESSSGVQSPAKSKPSQAEEEHQVSSTLPPPSI